MRRAAKVVLSLLRAATLALSCAEILRMCEITGLDRVSPLDGTPLVPVRFANGVHEPLWECINVGYLGGCGRVHIATLGAGYDRGSPNVGLSQSLTADQITPTCPQRAQTCCDHSAE